MDEMNRKPTSPGSERSREERPQHFGSEQPIGEWAASQARGAADTARQGVEQAAGYVQDAMGQTREYVQGALEQARGKVAQYRDGGFEKVKDDMVSYTREQPVAALLIAAGVGLMLGWLTAMGRR